MRAMLLDFQDDPAAIPLWDQYMFGRDLLVAPVIREGETSRDVYLPQGRWWHLFQNRWFDGGRTHRVDAPLDEIPVFVREHAVLPLAFHRDARLGGAMPSGIDVPTTSALLVAGLKDGETTFQGDIEIAQNQGIVSVRTNAGIGRSLLLVFADAPAAVQVNGTARPLVAHDLCGVPLPALDLAR
jgi:alpha-glucosidase (family GH31 glycosyl hydrolase)